MTHPMTVMAVCLVIWFGLFGYLVYLACRLGSLEKQVKSLTMPKDEQDER